MPSVQVTASTWVSLQVPYRLGDEVVDAERQIEERLEWSHHGPAVVVVQQTIAFFHAVT